MRFRFGEHELDTESRQLLRGGAAIQLWPKVFDLLQYLVEQRGRLVTKQELLDRVWSDSHVADSSLLWTVSHARRALDQRAGQKSPIETVHRRGYRFSADVEVIRSDVSCHPAEAPGVRPFVGREAAMRQLEARLRDAEELKRGDLCMLVGPPGIGKTRCMDELAAVASVKRFDVWVVRCLEDAWAPAFLPWILVLRAASRARPTLSARVEALLQRRKQQSETEELEQSYWWLDGVTRLLIDAANEKPIVIALDDLQWADTASLDLFAFLAQELRHAPLVVVTSIRSEATFAPSRGLKRLWRHAYRIELELLSEADIARYVSLTASDQLRPDTLAALHRSTAGNPLFLEHTLRELLARHGRGALADLAPAAISPAPIARDMLRAALDRLDVSTRELLGMASVLGERFELSDLQALSGIDSEGLLRALETCVREALVVAEGPSVVRFSHALMRTVVYDDLPMQCKLPLHRRAAETLEGLDPSRVGEVAHHFYRSLVLGDAARVAAVAERAARAAARLHAFADAARFTQWAMEAQTLEVHASPRARAELAIFHAEMQAGAGAVGAARETIVAVVQLARAHGLYDLFVRFARILRPYTLMASLEDPCLRAWLEEALEHAPPGANAMRVSALSQLSWMPPYALDSERSKAMSGEALELARALQDKSLLLHALNARLHALSGPDDCALLLATADEMQTLESVPNAWVAASVLSARYGAHLQRGELLEAAAARESLGRLAHSHKWPVVIWLHDRLVVQELIQRGDLAAATSALDSLQQLAERWQISFAVEMHPVLQGLITLESRGRAALCESVDRELLRRGLDLAPVGLRPALGRLQLALGDSEAARAVLERDFADVPRDIGYLGALTGLAVLAVELDDRPRAQRLYALLAPYPQFNAVSLLLLHEGSVSHFLGILAAYLGLDADADRHFEAALVMNERAGLRPQLERTRAARARWLSTRSGAD